MSRFQFVADHAATYEVKRLCELLEVQRSSYYAWLQGVEVLPVDDCMERLTFAPFDSPPLDQTGVDPVSELCRDDQFIDLHDGGGIGVGVRQA